jgi:hypothetical protein
VVVAGEDEQLRIELNFEEVAGERNLGVELEVEFFPSLLRILDLYLARLHAHEKHKWLLGPVARPACYSYP